MRSLGSLGRYWVENQFFDFDEGLVQKLFDFVDNVLPKDGWGDIANILKKILKAQVPASFLLASCPHSPRCFVSRVLGFGPYS